MEPSTYVYKITKHCYIRADVYPAEKQDAPVIALIHGGGLICGWRKSINLKHVEHYTATGFSVVSIDHRLAPETRVSEIIQDVADACAWIRKEGAELFGANTTKLAVVGYSAGGYLALTTGFAVCPPPRAIVSFYGYADFTAKWCNEPTGGNTEGSSGIRATRSTLVREISEGRSGRGSIYEESRRRGTWAKTVLGFDPIQNPNKAKALSPYFRVTRDYPPTMLLHGEKDGDVPCEESKKMADVLARANLEHRLVVLKGKGHGFDVVENDSKVNTAFRDVIDFLKKHIG